MSTTHVATSGDFSRRVPSPTYQHDPYAPGTPRFTAPQPCSSSADADRSRPAALELPAFPPSPAARRAPTATPTHDIWLPSPALAPVASPGGGLEVSWLGHTAPACGPYSVLDGSSRRESLCESPGWAHSDASPAAPFSCGWPASARPPATLTHPTSPGPRGCPAGAPLDSSLVGAPLVQVGGLSAASVGSSFRAAHATSAVEQVPISRKRSPAAAATNVGRVEVRDSASPTRPVTRQPVEEGAAFHAEALDGQVRFVPIPSNLQPPPNTPPRTAANGSKAVRLFFGQLPLGATPALLAWLCRRLSGGQEVFNVDMICRGGSARRRSALGCAHAYCTEEAAVAIIAALNKRALIDKSGVWAAVDERELAALDARVERLRCRPELRPAGLPANTIVVQYATSSFVTSSASKQLPKATHVVETQT